MSRPPPGARADYRSFVPVTTRWIDNDVFGHVNNAVYYSFIDTAVTTLLVRWGILTWPGPHRAMADRSMPDCIMPDCIMPDCIMVVAEGGCRFHSEVAFPDPLAAGVRISRMGERSIRVEVGIFRGDDPVAAAEGFLVHVCVDAATRRPVPLPDDWRRILQPLVMES